MLIRVEDVAIPARLLEILATTVGCPLTRSAASKAAGVPERGDWTIVLSLAARRAGLRAACFTIETSNDLRQLGSLGTPAVLRVDDERWLIMLGARWGSIDVVVLDGFGEHRSNMSLLALRDWLHEHGAALPMRWMAVEARMMLASTEHAATPMRRLLATVKLERHDISVALVFGAAMAVTSLAVPIAAQAIVNTVASRAMLQPLLVLSLMLLVALGAVSVLQVMQIVVAERIHRRMWVRTVTDWIRRLPRMSREARQRHSNHELANRFFDVVLLQKDVVSLLLDGTSLVLTMGASLVLLAFYHPYLLVFDIALVFGIALVVVSGWGAGRGAVAESDRKYELFAWMDDVAGGRLLFADPRGRAFAEARGELLLRNWVQARATYFTRIARQITSGVGLQVIASVVLLSIGGWLVIQRQLTLGQLVASSVLVSTIGAGLTRLGRQLDPLFEAAAAVATLGVTLDAKLEDEGGVLLPRKARPMAVELRDRTQELSLVIALQPGERLGLRGCTGAHGRVLDLLYGLFGHTELTTLRARLDGLETHMLDPESLRDQVALVRGGELVWASVRENLDLQQDVDDIELLELLELVELRERLLGLPQGLETLLLGDADGGPLDESEICRLVLVRALLARPRLLLIDRGLDALELSAGKREQLLDWLFDRQRPWTLIVTTQDDASDELLARCDHRMEIPSC